MSTYIDVVVQRDAVEKMISFWTRAQMDFLDWIAVCGNSIHGHEIDVNK